MATNFEPVTFQFLKLVGFEPTTDFQRSLKEYRNHF